MIRLQVICQGHLSFDTGSEEKTMKPLNLTVPKIATLLFSNVPVRHKLQTAWSDCGHQRTRFWSQVHKTKIEKSQFFATTSLSWRTRPRPSEMRRKACSLLKHGLSTSRHAYVGCPSGQGSTLSWILHPECLVPQITMFSPMALSQVQQ